MRSPWISIASPSMTEARPAMVSAAAVETWSARTTAMRHSPSLRKRRGEADAEVWELPDLFAPKFADQGVSARGSDSIPMQRQKDGSCTNAG